MIGEQEFDSAQPAGDGEEPREIEIEFADSGEDASSDAPAQQEAAHPPEDQAPEDEQLTAQTVEETEAPADVQGETEEGDSPEHQTAEHQTADPPTNGSTVGIETQGVALAEFQSQIDALTREKNVLYDQLLRRQAEFENFRKRTERDKAETYNRARADIIVELLPVIDNFERAITSLETSGEDAAGLRHGIELIHKQFKDILTKLGLEPVEAVGQTFDPHLHEAVATETTEEHEDNTVIEEFERGYKLGNRLLRPAKVKVASNPED